MAIYKSSNCSPFLSCLDLTKAQDVSCELNTSNELVTGYKIKILDSNNDVIFSGSKFDSIDIDGYENSGLNGSVLTIPLIVEGAPINSNTIGYLDGEFTVQSGSTFDSTKFFNGYINQPYKWEIVLEQGNLEGEKADKYYDMTITQGKILGSTKNRIQSYLSENIYKDYFIQLNNVAKRVLINSYDHTYGYLYPQENKFTDVEIALASYFEIYKFSNDPDVVAAGSQVAFATDKSMNSVQIGGQTSSEMWGDNLTYPNYFKQVFNGLSQSYKNNIPNSAFDDGMSNVLGVGTIIMVKEEGNGSSAYNGIFKLNSINENKSVTSSGETTYDLTLTWLRSTPGDTWANLTNTVFYVQNGSYAGKRLQVQTDSQTVGTINQTSVVFVPEKPVEIYVDASKGYGGNSRTRGQIFRNTSSLTYIRPFIGVVDGMRFSYLRNKEIQYKNVDIQSINTETWAIRGNIGVVLTPDTDQYKITTYFKSSDENPFYAYTEPEISIEYEGDILPPETSKITTIEKRMATFQGKFVQTNNKTWINYQWFLNDLSDGTEEHSDKYYSGDLSYTFFGLQDGHIYQIVLLIEDEFGVTYRTHGNIAVDMDLISSTSELSVVPDCLTQSYIIDFNKIGVVIPDPEKQTLKYRVYNSDRTNKEAYTVKEKSTLDSDYEYFIVNDMQSEGYTISYPLLQDNVSYLSISNINDVSKINNRDALMKYDKVRIVGEDITAFIPSPTENACTFNSQHRLDPRFNGSIIEYKFDADDFLSGTVEAKIKVYLPPVTQANSDGEIEVYVDDLASYSQYDAKGSLLFDIAEEAYYVKDAATRYSIIAVYTRKYANGDELILASRILEWDNDRENAKIVSAWVEPNTQADDNCDYLDTDIVYNTTPNNPNYRHIRGKGAINSHGEIGFVISSAEHKGNFSYWEDKERVIVTQADGTKINVWSGKDNYNYWNDTQADGMPNYWYDEGSEVPAYEQININDEAEHTGRQLVHDKILTLNLALRNYDNTSYTTESFNSETDFVFNLFEEEAK